MKTTKYVRKEDVKDTWYLIDASDVPVGRLASMAACILRGKHRPDFTPNIDMGDHVVVINAEKVVFTGNKLEKKNYYSHSGYPGGMKVTSAREMLDQYPERVLSRAVKGMLPKSRLGRKLLKKFRIYRGAEHPHEAQKPTQLKITDGKSVVAAN